MKKCLSIVLSFYCALSFADTITLMADEWCPYTCDPGAANPGYMIEIAKLAFEAKGHKVDYKLISWERALQMVREGKVAGAVGAEKSELKEGIYGAEPMGLSMNSFFVPSSSTWTYTGPDSLKGQRVGLVRGYPYEEVLETYFKANPGTADYVSGDSATETNIKKMAAGRINSYVENEAVFQNTIKNMGLQGKFKKAGTAETEATEVYIAFSPVQKTSVEYAKILSDKVAELRASGELKKILAKYGLEDWK